MKPLPPTRISLSLALESLRDAVADVDQAQQSLQQSRAVRDDLIRDMMDGGVMVARISRLTGLSRTALYRIYGKPFQRDERAV